MRGVLYEVSTILWTALFQYVALYLVPLAYKVPCHPAETIMPHTAVMMMARNLLYTHIKPGNRWRCSEGQQYWLTRLRTTTSTNAQSALAVVTHEVHVSHFRVGCSRWRWGWKLSRWLHNARDHVVNALDAIELAGHEAFYSSRDAVLVNTIPLLRQSFPLEWKKTHQCITFLSHSWNVDSLNI